MEFRVLGPLEVVDGDRAVELGGPRQRALLAYLLVHANEAVAAERLVEELWGGSASGANALQVSVSRLRKALGSDDRLLTQPAGYLLRVAPEECDRELFEQLFDEARRDMDRGDAGEAADALRQALALWRGQPFADFRYEPFAQAEIARLEELRLSCLEARIDADLALGRHTELVSELEALTREQPLRQRPRAQLMLALYRSGRHADALEIYQATRRHLVEELGIEPSGDLRELHQAILRQDTELEAPEPEPPESLEPAEEPPPLGPDARSNRRRRRSPSQVRHRRRLARRSPFSSAASRATSTRRCATGSASGHSSWSHRCSSDTERPSSASAPAGSWESSASRAHTRTTPCARCAPRWSCATAFSPGTTPSASASTREGC